MKSFKEYLVEENYMSASEFEALNENLKSELTTEEEARIEEALDAYVAEYLEKGKSAEDFNIELTTEGLIGSILGGLTGFALGKSVGKIIAKVLGINKGILYDLLTSRLVGAALGAALGKKI